MSGREGMGWSGLVVGREGLCCGGAGFGARGGGGGGGEGEGEGEDWVGKCEGEWAGGRSAFAFLSSLMMLLLVELVDRSGNRNVDKICYELCVVTVLYSVV